MDGHSSVPGAADGPAHPCCPPAGPPRPSCCLDRRGVGTTQGLQRGQAPQDRELGLVEGAGCRSHTCTGLGGGAGQALAEVQLCTQGLQQQALLLTLLLQERRLVLQPAEG